MILRSETCFWNNFIVYPYTKQIFTRRLKIPIDLNIHIDSFRLLRFIGFPQIPRILHIYIYCAKHSPISLNIEKLCFRGNKWCLKCLTSTNVMMFLSILNFHRRVKIDCSAEHVSVYTLVWCSWNCLGRMQVLHMCFDMCVVVVSCCVCFVIMQTCVWLWII